MPMFSKGIILAQHKEPAFSKPPLRFVTPQTDSLRFETDMSEIGGESDVIIEVARGAQIVDERDGKLLYRKLLRSREDGVSAVVADAVDDEPYVSSKINPLLHYRREAVGALQLCQRAVGAERRYIMVYKMRTDLETRIPRTLERVRVVRVRGGYPAVSRAAQLRKMGKGRKLIIGAGALIHLFRAYNQQKRQSTSFVTVAGNCVSNPVNLEVSLGMTVMQILDRCGMSREPTRIVCGGSMTGFSILDADNTLVTYTTRAILAFWENERDSHYTCIGCGRCEQVCPSGLNPMYIYRFVKSGYMSKLPMFDAQLCIGCGTCSYICPSKLEVATAVRKARDNAAARAGNDRDGEEVPT